MRGSACVAQPDFEKIRPMLEARFWTWSEYARQANISLPTLLSLRAGRRRASFKTVRKLADALGVDPREIVKKED